MVFKKWLPKKTQITLMEQLNYIQQNKHIEQKLQTWMKKTNATLTNYFFLALLGRRQFL